MRWAIGGLAVLGIAAAVALGPDAIGDAMKQSVTTATSEAAIRTQSVPSLIAALMHESDVTRWASLLLQIAGATWLLTRRRVPTPAALALACGIALLVQTVTWEHYLALNVIGLIAVVDLLRVVPRTRHGAIGGLAAVGFLLLAIPVGNDGRESADVLHTLASGAHTYGTALVCVALAAAMRLSTTPTTIRDRLSD